jgi:uncharacterized protein YyaL (SSP411 family)
MAFLLVAAPAGARAPSQEKSGDVQQSQQKTSSVQREGGHKPYTNRLIHEKSPYLLLHAHNPVDWYPWGEEAFAKAKRENKPIFLSVGYFTCHWCHVMERESFSNPQVAELMNRWFVSIKVDREERPDIDRVYLTFLEAATGSGGWPMTVFLTPDLKPFFGGTYFPPQDQYGRPGLLTLLPKMADAWKTGNSDVVSSATEITEKLQAQMSVAHAVTYHVGSAVLDKTYEQIKQSYDSKNAGFGSGRKFPRPVALEFLFRDWKRTQRTDSLEMALRTLQAMAAGGVHDQLGGGFHRYSTDPEWRVPHFEKMLYDQAQLAISYTEAYQITHESSYAAIARETLDFALREMRSPYGAFYSALDADSPLSAGNSKSGEGIFYVWTAGEIEKLLGPQAAPVFAFRYGVETGGNVPPNQDIEGWLEGKNVLYQSHSLSETAKKFSLTESQTEGLLAGAREKLLAARRSRPAPPRDTKIITAWNGLMISALAKASQVLEEPKYLAAAVQVSAFLKVSISNPVTGRLKRRYREGNAAVDGFVEDYAFLIQGLLDLYEAGFQVRYLQWARRLQAEQDRLFWDDVNSGYFTSGTQRKVILRTRESYDGAEPSPNSVAAMNLLRLWQYAGDDALKQKADRVFAVFGAELNQTPEGSPYLASALDFSLDKHKQIVIAGDPTQKDTRELLRLVWSRFMPNRILMLADGSQAQAQLASLQPVVETMSRKDGKATAYICENFVCQLPTNDPTIVARLLDGK